MIIKVCGMREPDNISAVSETGIDMMGFIFWEGSPRCVRNVAFHAGILPDTADESVSGSIADSRIKRVGVFVDEMPQNIITQTYNYHLDLIQLHGSESPTYIDNLRRTLVPDIAPDIRIIKALSIREADDVKRWRDYEHCVDMFLFDTKSNVRGGSGMSFDWSLLRHYDGTLPFLLSGGISPESAGEVLKFRHPQFAGIDLNSMFESEPGVKDLNLLKPFISKIRSYE